MREREREGERGGRERERQRFYILQVAAGPMYWVHNLNKTVGKRREREQGKREIDKEICMDDWQYPRINVPFAYFKWLQVK